MLNREEVLKIAKLARLTLNEEEIGFFQKQLTRVLGHIQDLNQVPTGTTSFVQHIPSDAEPFRKDDAEPFPSPLDLMKNAPSLENNSFLLPTIVEHS